MYRLSLDPKSFLIYMVNGSLEWTDFLMYKFP